MNENLIEQLPKGALKDKPSDKDYKLSFAAPVGVDWSKEYRVPDPGDADQGSSDSCVGHAWSYYHKQLKGKNFSRRDLFCRIFQDYGAYIRDGGVQVVKNGQATNSEVSDPAFQTEANMRSADGTSQSYRDDDKEYNSFVLTQQDINGVAWGIKEYKGVVFGVEGDNYGWRDLVNPEPPSYGVPVWGHAIYAMGYHMHNGQKCIIAKSSWCNSGAKEHHIKETYFITGHTFSAWTLIPNPLTTPGMKLVKNTKDKTVGIYTGNKDHRILAFANVEALGLLGDEPQYEMDFGNTPIYNIVKNNPNGDGTFVIVKK
jgi:hypothetical protein